MDSHTKDMTKGVLASDISHDSPQWVASLAKSTLQNFLSCTGISLENSGFDHSSGLEQRVREVSAKWDLDDEIPPKDFELALVNAVWIAGCAYSHIPLDAQVHIALYTLLATCIDDLNVPRAALEEFMERFYSKSSQLHPLLDLLVENILTMDKYFPPFPKKLIISSTVDFVNMMAFEQEDRTVALRPTSSAFATLKRFYNGAANAYFLFVFDKFTFPDVSTYIQALPDAAIYVCYANDLCSFYKEEIVHETANLVHDRAVVGGTDVVTSLKNIINEMIEAVARTRLILTGDAERRAWENHMSGYILYHYLSPRYRLHEVLGDSVNL